jgi:hypothetical protein
MAYTTLANVKQWLDISGSGDDALIGRLIISASTFIDSFINRKLLRTTYSERWNGNDRDILNFQQYPATAVSSLVVNGTTVDASPDGIAAGYYFSDYFSDVHIARIGGILSTKPSRTSASACRRSGRCIFSYSSTRTPAATSRLHR